MMKKYFGLFMVSLLCSSGFSQAGILRDDISDVLEKSKNAAKPFNAVGQVACSGKGGERFFSGVALDPWTVLTCAHAFKFLDTTKPIVFCTDSGMLAMDGVAVMTSPWNVIILDEYVERSKSMKFQQSPDHMEKLQERLGLNSVDLAILKLDMPLPEDLDYPKLWEEAYPQGQQYGATIGYGDILLNGKKERSAKCTKHLFYSKATYEEAKSKSGTDLHVLCSPQSYKHPSNQKNFKVIPNKMRDLEGASNFGDSGAPLFFVRKSEQVSKSPENLMSSKTSVKHSSSMIDVKGVETKKEETYLAGIMSGCEHFKSFPQKPDEYDNFVDYWVPIQKHLAWIKKHMGAGGLVLTWKVDKDLVYKALEELEKTRNLVELQEFVLD